MPSAALALNLVSALGSGVLALKLYFSGLSSRYRIFFVYFVFRFFCVSYSTFADPSSIAYFYFFVFVQPITWVFYVLVVRELFGLVLARHEGFYTLGRWAMYAVTVVSVLVSALTLLPKITPEMPQTSRYAMPTAIALERGVDFSLTIFLLLMIAVLGMYAVPLSRNVLVHAVIYTIFFLSSEFGMILRNIFGLKYAAEVDTGMTAASCACVLAWILLISAKGEETAVHLPWFQPEQEERILYQLDALNATLMKVARK